MLLKFMHHKTRLHLSDSEPIDFSADLWGQDLDGNRTVGLLSYFRSLEQFGCRAYVAQVRRLWLIANHEQPSCWQNPVDYY